MLSQIRGVVEVYGKGDCWVIASAGQTVESGQRVRTGVLSSVQVAFYDGSVAHLGPESEVSVDRLDQEAGGSRIIELTQWVGETDHDVAPAYGDSARYEVHTPSGTGEAKGTFFHVSVTPALIVHFVVDEGAVAVTHLDVTVVVVAGQSTTATTDRPPGEPVFRVHGEGKVEQTGATWRIAGQDFQTHDATVIIGNPQVGDWVRVGGHLAPDGARVADRIALLSRAPENRFRIQGKVDTISDDEWTVAGQTIHVNDDTYVDDDIEKEDLVHVEGIILEDGALLAERIRLIHEDAPGLPFNFVGIIQHMEDETWTISGIPIAVQPDTQRDKDLAVQEVVRVRGWILDDGTWVARSILRPETHDRVFDFTGYVEQKDPWIVSGISVETRSWTEIEPGIAIGDAVKVEGRILEDGTWLAQEIKLLDDDRGLRLEFVGRVLNTDPWIVSGIQLIVDDETETVGEVDIGTLVKVAAEILPSGEVHALKIVRIHDVPVDGCTWFSGVIVRVESGQIVLKDGHVIALDDPIEVDGEIQPESVVLVYLCVNEDGTAVIVKIVVIYQLEPPPTIIIIQPPVDEDDDDCDDDDCDEDEDEGGKVTICHKPGTPAEKTKRIPLSALGGHLGHGDYRGPCK
jgi:hypothetical protein